MHFHLTKNNIAVLNNERLAKIWNLGNVKLQTRNWKLILRLPMKNLMLKVSNLIFKRAFFSLQGSSFFKTIIRKFRDLYLVASCGEQFLLLIEGFSSTKQHLAKNSNQQKHSNQIVSHLTLGRTVMKPSSLYRRRRFWGQTNLHMLSLLRSDGITMASPSKSS